jgi:hypothetical protein
MPCPIRNRIRHEGAIHERMPSDWLSAIPGAAERPKSPIATGARGRKQMAHRGPPERTKAARRKSLSVTPVTGFARLASLIQVSP